MGGPERGPYGGTSGVATTCLGCGAVARRAQRPKRMTACAACCTRHASGRYDERFPPLRLTPAATQAPAAL